MSFLSVTLTLIVSEPVLPAGLSTWEDPLKLPFDEQAFLYASSRNGWLVWRLGELVDDYGLWSLPYAERQVVAVNGGMLGEAVDEIGALVDAFVEKPERLQQPSAGSYGEDAVARVIERRPDTLSAALAAMQDEEGCSSGQGDTPAFLFTYLWAHLHALRHAQAANAWAIATTSV